MKLDRDAARKLASLSAVGLGALGSAGEAEAAAIVVNAGDAMVGFRSGAGASFSHNFGGPRFLFDRYTTFSSTTSYRVVRALGYGGLEFAGSVVLDIFGSAESPGSLNWIANAPVASWRVHTAGSTQQLGGQGTQANKYAFFRMVLSGLTHYGWLELSISNELADQGPTLTIHRFAYESVPETFLASGDTVGASGVPEPSAFLMSGLGALGLGAAGIRRWRAAHKQAA